SWNDDLAIPFSAIPRYVGEIRAGRSLDRPTERLRRERDEIIARHRSLLTTDADRGAFDQMLGLAQMVFPFVEDHKFYCEHWAATAFFRKMKQFGALLARFGFFEDAEDIFHLQHAEVTTALSDLALAWAAGTTPAGPA